MFRVDPRGHVVLNEVENGTVVTVDKPEAEAFAWDLNDTPPPSTTTTTTPSTIEQEDPCGEDGARPPVLTPDRVGTRPGRPVVVRVLANDQIDDCDVGSISLSTLRPATAQRSKAVQNDTALQVTPAISSGEIRVDYVVVTLTDSYPGSLTVEVAPDGNRPPTPEDDHTFHRRRPHVRLRRAVERHRAQRRCPDAGVGEAHGGGAARELSGGWHGHPQGAGQCRPEPVHLHGSRRGA